MYYSKKDKELLKVAKMNSDDSESAHNLAEQTINNAKKKNLSEEAFIETLKEQYGISANEDCTYYKCADTNSQINYNWDDLLKEANSKLPYDVKFEDLLSNEEYERACDRIDEINNKFNKITGFNKADWIFLVVAIALQCVRQYVLDPLIKSMRKPSGADDEPKEQKKSNAEPGWYRQDTNKIITSKVPFDVNKYGTSSTIQGFLKGGKGHRLVTLGHDPILGWIFGTANILTNTVTRYDFQSAHVKYDPRIGNYIHSTADTITIFEKCVNRVSKESDGKIALVYAIAREAIHLKSDINTKSSLPIPIISTISMDIANELAKYGIDTAGVGTEMSLSVLINFIISIIHSLFYNENNDGRKLYEVKTRKIILYSNLIASTSNAIIAALTENAEILDIGGLVVTISRLFYDSLFIMKIKQEFVDSELAKDFKGTVEEINQMYDELFIDKN